jgi:hypothetical protein
VSYRFSGDSYLALDRSNYVDIDDELSVKLKFRADSARGLLMLIGDTSSAAKGFVSLELRDRYLVYSFNLGDTTTVITSEDAIQVILRIDDLRRIWNTSESRIRISHSPNGPTL